jgi:hypothetical protein
MLRIHEWFVSLTEREKEEFIKKTIACLVRIATSERLTNEEV